MQYQANNIADFFLSQVDTNLGDTISPIKLQKLVYYAQAWNYTIFDRPLFDERVEAWTHGPVVRSIYERFKEYPIYSPLDLSEIRIDEIYFDSDTLAILNDVNMIYGEHSGKYLEDLTHNENPWINARAGIPPYLACTNEITLKSMKSYYSKIREPK
ncbi:DUF4065 domain-containing protein [Mucilaginibacter sabulilitoris]|uniref:DUF4065 domain-containing protein n=1 Tax=Mucilaginibacter sabulilitoris TaxID=1173583 RepID=A0ABZ0TDH7_9SPHI|nr:type II toxin-antitoxin system antitoxin SocA domain-containing protein [Mucilaginibacter sabulilitoris]WPU91274.1 DUF4065 domain-containing protein [Mucilaginibacter sabulilitoris]